MKPSIVESWFLLVYIDLLMRLRSFKTLYKAIYRSRVHPMSEGTPPSCAEICRAIDLACVFYFKQVHCLQRSAATTLLLRRLGWDAQMIIGVQIVPFKSHAWVEIDRVVVNDKPYIRDLYQSLQHC